VAVRVYTPAVAGAVRVTGTPFRLVVGLTEPPPAGVKVQVTPAGSLVVADTLSVWLTVSAAARGEMEIVPFELMVRVRLAVPDCGGVLESVTVNVS
jgi:hypothetical protein